MTNRQVGRLDQPIIEIHQKVFSHGPAVGLAAVRSKTGAEHRRHPSGSRIPPTSRKSWGRRWAHRIPVHRVCRNDPLQTSRGLRARLEQHPAVEALKSGGVRGTPPSPWSTPQWDSSVRIRPTLRRFSIPSVALRTGRDRSAPHDSLVSHDSERDEVSAMCGDWAIRLRLASQDRAGWSPHGTKVVYGSNSVIQLFFGPMLSVRTRCWNNVKSC